MKANEALLSVAMSQLGTKEIVGGNHEIEVLKYYKEIGHSWVADDETPWCAAFLNWVCLHALTPMVTKSQRLRARGFLEWGYEVERAQAYQGDIVVLWRKSKDSASGHVGLLIGWSVDREFVYLLGGNQSNQVKVAKYAAARILSIRRGQTHSEIVFAPKIQAHEVVN